MNKATKQKILGTICVICAVVMVVCIARMIPYGMAGEVNKVKPYFAVVVVMLIVSLPAAVGYYYYRGGDTAEDKELERMRVEADILSHIGEKAAKPKPSHTAPDTNRLNKQ